MNVLVALYPGPLRVRVANTFGSLPPGLHATLSVISSKSNHVSSPQAVSKIILFHGRNLCVYVCVCMTSRFIPL